MRQHRDHVLLRPWSIGAPIVDAAHLVAVRLEPVLLGRGGAVALDVVLEHGDALTVIPGIVLDAAALLDRDRDALIFPDGTPGGDTFGVALAARILPHCERALLDGVPVAEHVVTLAPSQRFDAARAAGCYGAAPLRDALARLGPYRIARRYARGLSVAIDARDAVAGWALLRDVATVGVAERRRDPAACAWYGVPPDPVSGAEVAIVDRPEARNGSRWAIVLDGISGGGIPVVDPVPLDLSWSNDPADGPAVAHVAVAGPAETPSAVDLTHIASGGSGGRIAIVPARADVEALPAADTDEAEALAAALRAEGFEVDVGLLRDAAHYDLLHVIGTRDGARAHALVEAGRRARIPVVLTAHDDAPEHGGWWGAAVAQLCFEHARDEVSLQTYLALLARRALSVGPIDAATPYAPPGAGASQRRSALLDATLVMAQDEAEAEALRELGRTGPIHVVPAVVRGAQPAPVGTLVGAERFVFVHAPIGPAGNQLLVARVAADLRVPLVLAGPVEDAAYLERIRRHGGNELVVLPGEPSPAVARGLRLAASVVVDAAWVGWGAGRIAAALLDGARVVAAERRRGPACHAIVRVDPADQRALARAIGESWDAAGSARVQQPALVERLHPSRAVRAIVAGYAAAVGAR